MEKREIIIQVGAEGGCITLYGMRTDQGWNFRQDVNDQTPEMLNEAAIQYTLAGGSSWQYALKLMDQYSWHKLYPLEVHPEFRAMVLEEVRSRSQADRNGTIWDGSQWEMVCQSQSSDAYHNGKDNDIFRVAAATSFNENSKNEMSQLNIVYVLSNSAMPGYIKIGYTKQSDAQLRIDQLYTSGIPVPFDLEYACKVKNAEEVEKALHIAFGPARVNSKREFFKIDPEQAIAILKLLHTEDATSEVALQPTTLDLESVIAAEQLKAKRSNMNFNEMGIPVGAASHSVHADIAVTVCGPKKVLFSGEEVSLTAATRQILGIDYSVQPSPYWTYQGKLLKTIYEETYSAGE